MPYYRIIKKEDVTMKLGLPERLIVQKEINKRLKDLGVKIRVEEVLVEDKTTIKLTMTGEDTIRLLKNI